MKGIDVDAIYRRLNGESESEGSPMPSGADQEAAWEAVQAAGRAEGRAEERARVQVVAELLELARCPERLPEFILSDPADVRRALCGQQVGA